jgi:hypothetical protein
MQTYITYYHNITPKPSKPKSINMATILVLSVISYCFPMAIVTRVSTALGFVGYGIAPGMDV